jgi:hypothetical protein
VPQALPHAPQLLTSVVLSTHEMPHIEPRHSHVLLKHSFPFVHALPQEPQFASLQLMSVQEPLQQLSPEVQLLSV